MRHFLHSMRHFSDLRCRHLRTGNFTAGDCKTPPCLSFFLLASLPRSIDHCSLPRSGNLSSLPRSGRPAAGRQAGLAVGGWRLAVGGWRPAAGGWRLAAGGWRLAAGGGRPAPGPPPPCHPPLPPFLFGIISWPPPPPSPFCIFSDLLFLRIFSFFGNFFEILLCLC